jgi:hypothetical protein
MFKVLLVLIADEDNTKLTGALDAVYWMARIK